VDCVDFMVGRSVKMAKASDTNDTKIAKALFAKRKTVMSKKFSEFGKNSQWLAKNRQRLRKDHGNMFVAVHGQDICFSDKDIDKIRELVLKKYGHDQEVIIDYIGKQKLKLLL